MNKLRENAKLQGYVRRLIGIFCGVFVILSSLMTVQVRADGDLMYGQAAGDYIGEQSGTVTIGAQSGTQSSDTVSVVTAASSGVTIGSASDFGGFSFGVSSGSSASETTSDSSVSSSSDDLMYGTKAVDLFDTTGLMLTIVGKKNAATVSDTGSSFRTVYNELSIYVYLRRQGFSAASACGILGNIMRESSFNAEAVNSSSGAYGLYQCQGYMKTWLNSLCSDVTDPLEQTEAMILTMAPKLFVTYAANADNMTYAEFKKLTDPSEAAEIWRAVVEQNHYSAYDTSQRQKFAENFYKQWENYDGDGFDIIEEAVKYLGGPYALNGNSLTEGIDCSHFVCKILTLTGHYSGEYKYSGALRSLGTEVKSLEDAEPGDILCWNGHVAFYISDGYYINAANKASGICIGNGDIENMLGGLITIRRVR